MFNFNLRGNLKPPEIIETEWDNFFSFFVEKNESVNRKNIGRKLFQFLSTVQQAIDLQAFEIWVDGSFVTQKDNPNDVDVLIHVTVDVYQKHEKELRRIINHSKQETDELIDAYLMITFPREHKNYHFYIWDLAEWQNIFGKTRPTVSGKRFPKGILKIIFNEKK